MPEWKVKYENLKSEFDAILDSSSDGIHITDGDGYTIEFNKACERIDGVKKDYIIGKNMRELVAKGIYSESVALAVIREEKEISKIQKVNGKEVIGTGTPIFKDGKLHRIVINSRDITELNQLKKSITEKELVNKKIQDEIHILNKKETAKNSNLIYTSNEMDKIVELSLRVAKVDSTILVEGESGTGKGVLVNFIHKNSLRKHKPIIKIDCGAIPENLLESELFGYEKGSFTGARKEGKVGLIELANEGTLFLDEIGELPLNLQVKLLNLIQNKNIARIGGSSPIDVDIRIIAATNRDLKKMVEEKKFREDLYYRLNVVPIKIPPIRNRSEDIPDLIFYFLAKFNKKHHFKKSLSPQAIKNLLNYTWPGNIREIENLIERLVVTSKGDTIKSFDLLESNIFSKNQSVDIDLSQKNTFKNIVEDYEKDILLKVMNKCNSTVEMGEFLDLDPSTIRKKFKRYNICLDFKKE